jgi:hypothetical protein
MLLVPDYRETDLGCGVMRNNPKVGPQQMGNAPNKTTRREFSVGKCHSVAMVASSNNMTGVKPRSDG